MSKKIRANLGSPLAGRPKRERVFTPEERERRRQRDRQRVRTPEQIEAQRQRSAERYASMTPKEREQRRQRDSQRWQNKTPEQKAAHEQARQMIWTPHEATTDHTRKQILQILDGETPKHNRRAARGFEPWRPVGETLRLVSEVQAILREYRRHLPLTVRQILYRLMGRYGHEKTIESPLYTACRRARRARIIDMDAIRDDGGAQEELESWEDADEYLRTVQQWSQDACHDRQEGQPKRLVVYCEAVGMVPQLARVANPFGVPVLSSGGFDSLTEKHAFGHHRRNVEVLHIGDFDPHGIWMFIALAEDVSAFASAYHNKIDFTRIAVTPEQIGRLGLQTQRVSPDNALAFPGRVTCQAEAIAPDELANIVRDAIVSRLNMRTYRAVLKREKQLHAELAERLDAA